VHTLPDAVEKLVPALTRFAEATEYVAYCGFLSDVIVTSVLASVAGFCFCFAIVKVHK
jgi:hypothetical protein